MEEFTLFTYYQKNLILVKVIITALSLHILKSSEISSDRTGRILDLKNTHIIDSSVLPRVNVGPVTLTTMANSYRIVEEIFDI